MRKPLKVAGLVLIGLFVILQFFQPDRNLGPLDSENDLVAASMIPDSLANILKKSCYGCHSNHTDYPWYSYISPVSWFLEKHIRDGKEELNLSDYKSLDKSEKIGVMTDIYDVVEAGSMPLSGYVLIHRDALLTEEEIEAICYWSDMEALRIMNN